MLDIVVALVVIGACIALFRLGIMELLEDLFPVNELQSTIIRRTGVIVALFVGYLSIARFYERRPVTEFAVKPLETVVSAFSGSALIAITILSLVALGAYQPVSTRGLSFSLSIIGVILPAVVLEEVVFRGVIFRLAEERAGTVKALVAQAAIFGLLHLFNDGASVMTLFSVTILGLIWTLLYVWTRSLWVPIANHFTWNTTIFLSGVPLSGQDEWRLAAPLETRVDGPVWLTGGGFGPEDSILNILLMAYVSARLVQLMRRDNAFVDGTWLGVDRA